MREATAKEAWLASLCVGVGAPVVGLLLQIITQD